MLTAQEVACLKSAASLASSSPCSTTIIRRRIFTCATAASGRSSIGTLAVLDGALSPRVLGLVVEWASQQQDELRANWVRARRHAPLSPVQPLE
jgi:hypothetical protein